MTEAERRLSAIDELESVMPDLPNRQSIRKSGWNYAAAGWYFLTINTHEARALFGAIVNGRMVLNEAGRIAEACWREIPTHFPTARTGDFVIMPNHMHGLLELTGGGSGQAVACPCLGDVIGAYKAAVSRVLGRTGRQLPAPAIWHRNYWDVIVRDGRALAAIRGYIRDNPANYARVMRIGELRMLGNAELLSLPKLGFLASRGSDAPHGDLPLKTGEAVISGFLSAMERAVFTAGLAHKRPLIWVVPFGAAGRQLPAPTACALDDGRLLIISPFSDDIDAPSLRRAAWCNHYVLTHCDRLVVGHINPGGMLSCVLSEARPDLPIYML